MKAKVLKTFRDKETGSILRPGIIISITEERVEELTSTLDPFVEIIKEDDLLIGIDLSNKKDISVINGEVIESEDNTLIGLDLSNNKDMTVINGEVIEPKENDGEIDTISFVKMNKEEIVKYANEVMNIELNMNMTKAEMIELLEE